jgi:S-adenosylmethionine decarboxylase
MNSWGIHSIHNIFKACPDKIRCATTIYNFNKALVKKIDMKAFGEPQIVHFGTGNKAGFTLSQLIETSNITAHFVEETNDFYLDVFSCKDFQAKDVESVINEYFQPEHISTQVVIRQAKPKME